MEGLSRSAWRESPPTHFMFTVESFSTLSSSSFEKYETSEFDAGKYKWKLVLYPNGKTPIDSKDHISLYLVMADRKLEKEILVSFTLLVFDHNRNKYLSVQDVSRFDAEKHESGFEKFLPLKIFKDPSNGYLKNDMCVFGVDVFVMENTLQRQCLSMMMMKPPPFKYTWKVDNFSKLGDKLYKSEKFTTRAHDFKIVFHPKGNGADGRGNVSLYLELVYAETGLGSGMQVLVEFTLRVANQVNEEHKDKTYKVCLSESCKSWGSPAFMYLTDLNNTAGYLVDDTCILEAEVIVLGSAKKCD